jgi:hypothetical protein
MKFAQWFAEVDGQAMLPDPIQFSYLACVLDEIHHDHLKSLVNEWMTANTGHSVPPDWIWRAHHMTVKPPGVTMKDMEIYRSFFGQPVQLSVTQIAYNGKVAGRGSGGENVGTCIAVKVKPNVSFPMTTVPHITVAHSRAVQPRVSNDVLADSRNIYAINTAMILPSVFVAIYKDQETEWPKQNYKLAKAKS